MPWTVTVRYCPLLPATSFGFCKKASSVAESQEMPDSCNHTHGAQTHSAVHRGEVGCGVHGVFTGRRVHCVRGLPHSFIGLVKP